MTPDSLKIKLVNIIEWQKLKASHFMTDPFLFYCLDKQKSLSRYKTKNASLSGSINFFAERMGFEPTMQLPTY